MIIREKNTLFQEKKWVFAKTRIEDRYDNILQNFHIYIKIKKKIF